MSDFDKGADWFVKMERGLTPAEKKQLEQETAESPILREEIRQFENTKKRVQQLPSDFVSKMLAEEFEQESKRNLIPLFLGIAAAITISVSIFLWHGRSGPEPAHSLQQITAQSSPETHLLPDGSLIRLNADAYLETLYTPKLRQIRLIEGEALFEVASNPDLPFVVLVDDIEIRAIGTAFNVKRSEKIDVIVTHGIVEIFNPHSYSDNDVEGGPSSVQEFSEQKELVTVGQRAEVNVLPSSGSPNIDVYDIDVEELEAKLGWRASLLAVKGENLMAIAASFEQKTGYQLIIADPSLRHLRIGGRFPSNDVFGFLRILNTGYGIPWRQIEDGVIVLGNEQAEE